MPWRKQTISAERILAAMEDHGLPPGKALLYLFLVDLRAPLTQIRLAQLLHVDRHTIRRWTDDLRAKGLLEGAAGSAGSAESPNAAERTI